MSKLKFKKIITIICIFFFVSTSLLYFLYETGKILNHERLDNHTIKDINLSYMNKAIDGYNGEIDENEFNKRFISWTFLNLYSQDLFSKDIEFDFAFEENYVYIEIKIDQDVYQIYEFIEHEN